MSQSRTLEVSEASDPSDRIDLMSEGGQIPCGDGIVHAEG